MSADDAARAAAITFAAAACDAACMAHIAAGAEARRARRAAERAEDCVYVAALAFDVAAEALRTAYCARAIDHNKSKL